MKVVLFDVDGVTLKDNGYFSDRYARDYGVPLSKVTPFFKEVYRECVTGEKDLKEELAAWLPEWKWTKSVDEFVQYWFSSDADVDHLVLAEVEKLRARGIECYVASNQDKYRGEYIRTALGFQSRFDGCFFSHVLGVPKSDPLFFEKVIQELGVAPAEITYFDDDSNNVEAAKSLGIDARLYRSVADLRGIE